MLDCGVDERDIVTDKASGASLERDGYLALKNTMLRDGDTLVIKSLDRLSRNKEHIKQELEYFKNRHIRVRVIDLPTTMLELPKGQEWVFEMINNILIEVLASIAEQERLTIRQRQAEGIANSLYCSLKISVLHTDNDIQLTGTLVYHLHIYICMGKC